MASLSLVVIHTPELEKSRAFYEALLATKYIKEQHDTGPVHYSVELRHRIVFEIYPGIRTTGSLGFRCGSITATVARVQYLLERTPRFEKEAERIIRAIIYDPDGRRLQLTE